MKKSVEEIDRQILIWGAVTAILALVIIVVLDGRQVDTSEIEVSEALVGLAFGGDCGALGDAIVSNQEQSQENLQLYSETGETRYYTLYRELLQQALTQDQQFESCPEV
jgi:hypothetical protein|tara:strand:+ start:87 stop:413 length:327 start_codon:yes stop_codon:yes gene_type:complete